MARIAWFPILMAAVALCARPAAVSAAQPVAASTQAAETLLPATTKLFVSTPDMEETRKKFQATQLGAMTQDPLMQPFIEDLKRQIKEKMEAAGNGMGISLDDMAGLAGGEAVIARLQPDPKDKNSFAMVVLVDITGKTEQAKTLLKKIDDQQKKEGATRRDVKIIDGQNGVEYSQKPKKTTPRAGGIERDYYFIKGNFLVATDLYSVAQDIARRIGSKDKAGSLATVEAFKYAMERNAEVEKKDGLKFHVRWFMEPFGYMEASRAANRKEPKKGQDLLKILQAQGFSAIQGIGGYVYFNTPNDELLHRTYAYAPKDPKALGKDKYRLAARMLNFPNTKDKLTPQPWTMTGLGTYLTFNLKLQDAFKYSETLVDTIAGEPGVFDDMWGSLKEDPHGPHIDIYKGLIDHLGERASVLSDVLQPVDEKSERMLIAIEVIDEKTVSETIDKFFKDDPTARRKVFEGQSIWEIMSEQTASDDGPMLNIEGTDFVATKAEETEEEEAERKKLPNMAVTVWNGHLIIATHADYITDLLKHAKAKGTSLDKLPDFQRVQTALVRQGQGNDSFRFFAKTEESYRATYEMMKVNKLPETESMFARVLNMMLDDGSEGPRKNSIDGSKLPPYEKMVKYLGPAGMFVQTEDNGWWIVGTLQTREAGLPPEKK